MSDRVSIFMYLPRASTSDVNENELHGNACLQTLCTYDVNENIFSINETMLKFKIPYIIRLNYHISNRFDEILFIWNTIHVFLRHQYLAELSNYDVYVSFALFNELKRQKQTGILIYPYAAKNEHQKLFFVIMIIS